MRGRGGRCKECVRSDIATGNKMDWDDTKARSLTTDGCTYRMLHFLGFSRRKNAKEGANDKEIRAKRH